MPGVKAGVKAPLLNFNAARSSFVDGFLVTVKVYVLTEVPFSAVTTVVITLSPTVSGIAAEAVLEVTAMLLTFTVAWASIVVGVTDIEVMELGTVVT